MKTDYEKLIELLQSFGIVEKTVDNLEGYYLLNDTNDKEIYISPDPDAEKITGDGWAGVSFYFDKSGKFKNVEITGD